MRTKLKIALLGLCTALAGGVLTTAIFAPSATSAKKTDAETTYYYKKASSINDLVSTTTTSKRFYLLDESNRYITDMSFVSLGRMCTATFANATPQTKNGKSYITTSTQSPHIAIHFSALSLSGITIDCDTNSTFAWKYGDNFVTCAGRSTIGETKTDNLQPSATLNTTLSRNAYEIKVNDNSRFYSLSLDQYPLKSRDTTGSNNIAFTAGFTYHFNLYCETQLITVSLDKNGGTGGSNSTSAFVNESLDNITPPTREGYTFDGYFDASENQYFNSSGTCLKTCPASLTTLTAKWTPITTTLTFNNGTGAVPESNSINVTYDAVLPTVTVPVKTGYTFTGYYSSQSGGTKYYEDDGTSSSPSKFTTDTTIYAQWNANKYDIFCYGADDTICEKLTAVYDEHFPKITIPTLRGYTFTGYFDSNGIKYYEGDGTPCLDFYNIDGDLDLFSRFVANDYEITLNDGVSILYETKNVTFDGPIPSVEIPVRTGYTYEGYFLDLLDSSSMYFDMNGNPLEGFYNFDYDIEVYAKWTANEYLITFDNQRANKKGTESLKVTYDLLPNTIEIPEKEGFDFAGYWTEKYGEGIKVFNEDGTPVEPYTFPQDITLYAYWRNKAGNYTKSVRDILNTILLDNTLTINDNSFVETYSDSFSLLGDDKYYDRPDLYTYHLTGRAASSCSAINFIKPVDEEITFYINFDNLTYYNSNLEDFLTFSNKYASYKADGTIDKILDSHYPTHYVFLITGENYISGHNHSGIKFDCQKGELTVQFATVEGGTIHISSAFHESNISVPVFFEGFENIEDLLTKFDNHTRISEISLAQMQNLNDYNASDLENYVEEATNVKKFSPSYEGVTAALNKQFKINQPKNDSEYYTLLNLSLKPNHNATEFAGAQAVAPTCTEIGKSGHYICADCDLELSKVGGEFIPWLGSDDDTIEPLGHSFSYKIVKPATTDESGLKIKICSRCGFEEAPEIIPQLPKVDFNKELTPEQKEEIENAVSDSTELIPDIIDKIDPPDSETMSEEEYTKASEEYEEKQVLAEELSIALDSIDTINTTDTSKEESPYSEDDKKRAQENILDITETVTNEKCALDEEKDRLNDELKQLIEEGASEEKIAAKILEIQKVEEKQEILEIVTTEAVIVTAKQAESHNIAEACNLYDIPQDIGLGDLGQIFSDFMQRQIDELIGKNATPNQTRSIKRADNVNKASKIDYSVNKDVYKKVDEFVDSTIEKTASITNKVRNCSGVEAKKEIKIYVEKITSESFRDFDKEAADAEFVENAYMAILRNMQSQVLVSLEENKPSGNFEKEQKWQEEYKAVSDIEEFEIMVIEVMRLKFNSISAVQYDDVDTFAPIYKQIFTNWALNKEDNSQITLEELTHATIEFSVSKVSAPLVFTELQGNEKVVVYVFVSIAVVGIIAAIVIPTIVSKRKKGGVR